MVVVKVFVSLLRRVVKARLIGNDVYYIGLLNTEGLQGLHCLVVLLTSFFLF
jgi:hypothetical protein